MTAALSVPAAVARRFLVLRHHLAPPRSLPPEPASVMRVFDRLGSLQFDPLDIAGRNHDLVLLARIAGYERAWTDQLLYEERALFEAYNKGLSLLPTAELPWYRVTWDRNRESHDEGAFREHAPLVEELLERIRAGGPLSSTDVEPRAAIDWFWRPTNQVRAILEALAQAGILGLARREGNRRVYDLMERLLPADLLAERRPEREQRRHRLFSRFRAHGMLGRSGSAEIWMGTAPGVQKPDGPQYTRRELHAELVEDGCIVPVQVEGIRGERYIVAAELPLLEQAAAEVAASRPPNDVAPGAAFIAPLDPLAWDREFLRTLFAFDYIWEGYVPAPKRQWGYYVLPLLYGDRFVGRIEPRIERRTGTLRVLGLWWENGFDPLASDGFVDAFADALEAHRRFGRSSRITLPRTRRLAPFVAAVRKRLG
ncbi:MAG: winged helix DNA-binding domain-containing protein [Chloroflexota bacterium]|nr:winged helix DNA-binding domain-containing protein [Chloroflexota bacterium]